MPVVEDKISPSASKSAESGDEAQGVDKSNQRVQRMFASIADRYDSMNHLLSMQIDRLWRRKTVRIINPQAGQSFLDVCTGTGDLALALQKRQPDCRVVGADFCAPMLLHAERKKIKTKLEQVEFLEADTQNLPFDDNQFDAVSVAFGLRNVADTNAGLAEMTRVCKPGGKVVVLEFSMPQRQPVKFAYQQYFKHVLPRIGQFFAGNDEDAYNYLPDSVGEFPFGEALAERMRNAGLTEVTFKPLTFGVATLYVGVKPL
jgi:demethylmenaquinone methyltransferase/2-methoxy-6-polyprenyl-1,4-benzoquinol methylase